MQPYSLQPQGVGSEAYLNETSQGELVLSLSKEHSRTLGRAAISAVAVGYSRNIRARRMEKESGNVRGRREWSAEVVRMETERTRRIVELINRLNSEQMDRLERFLRELLGNKEEDKGR